MTRNQNYLSKDLLKIEGRLQEVLQPVRPRREFVEELRVRLDQEMVRKIKTKKVKTGLLVAGGVVGLAVMVISLIRSLTAWEGVIQSISKYFDKFRKREQPLSA
jgi:hypothetical protein